METHFVQEEIIADILSRMPVKSLVRFKCVSESWNKLISEPYFKRKHFNHAKNQKNSHKMLIGQIYRQLRTFYFYSSSLSSRRIVKDVQQLDCPSNSMPGFCKIYCCCDGLFLIGFHNGPKYSIFLLWNPSTRESILLPHPKSFSLAEEICTSISVYGLGYDSTSDDYKIVMVEQPSRKPNQIFTLKSGTWRKIDGSRRSYNISPWCNGMDCLAFVHGVFHWHGVTSRKDAWFSVISFNISSEVYGEVPLPKRMCLTFKMIDHGITVLGGMLCINCVYRNESTFLDLWVMKDYGVRESWTKLFTLADTKIPSIIPIIPKYMFAEGEVVFSCGRTSIFTTSRGPYGLSNKIWALASDDIDTHVSVRGYVYTESLISPLVNH